MGFVTCGFTSSKHDCFISCFFFWLEGMVGMLALCGYVFSLIPFFVFGKISLGTQFFAVVAVTVHMCVFVIFVMRDIYYESDMMFMIGHTEQINSVTTFGSSEINQLILEEEEDNKSCCQQNPWALYRKHYIVTSIKIIFLILDIVILLMFNDGWKCGNNTIKC